MKPIIKTKLANLPLLPGCYLMKDEDNNVIYVGKAKELKNRVGSYFFQTHSGKTAALVAAIADFDIIVTDSEQEALLLELSLIQQYYPKYNILLKDGKTYPYIVLTKEKDPRLIISRFYQKKMGKAFGPFPTPGVAYRISNLLNQLLPLRKCRQLGKKVCLYYHLKQCLAPCINSIEQDQYQQIADKISAFFQGDVTDFKKEIKAKMNYFAANWEFEEANGQKKLLEDIEQVLIKQKVDLNKAIDLDVIAYQNKNDYISVIIMLYRSGTLIGKSGQIIPLYGEEEDLITSYLIQYYKNNPAPKQIIAALNKDKDLLETALNCHIINPIKGKYQAMLASAANNAGKQMEQYFLYASDFNSDQKIKLLDQLGQLLKIKPPRRIELFDCSRMQGENGVATMVVFINCEAYKRGYRKYKLSATAIDNDYQGIKETIKRRLQHDGELADLIIVDGGSLQISAAKAAMAELDKAIPVAGLSKDNHHKTSKLINADNEEIILDRHSSLFHLLTRMQDEVHRFSITFFRQGKLKQMTASLLDQIPGLGIKRKMLLLKVFGSLAAIKEASREELGQYLPRTIVDRLLATLNNNLD